MATYVPPKIATELIFYVGLPSQANPNVLQANPTLAAGDVKVSIGGGAFNNLNTLPTVTPASGKAVKVTLSTSESNDGNAIVVFSDAAGDEWCDVLINVQTVARQVDDLAFPLSTGRGELVNTDGSVAPDWSQVKSPTTTVALSGTTVGTATTIGTTGLNAINAEVVDALNVDTYTEVTGVPGYPASIATMLRRLFATLINPLAVTATKKTLKNAAGVAQWEKDVADNGTTYTESEGNAP